MIAVVQVVPILVFVVTSAIGLWALRSWRASEQDAMPDDGRKPLPPGKKAARIVRMGMMGWFVEAASYSQSLGVPKQEWSRVGGPFADVSLARAWAEMHGYDVGRVIP